MDINTYLDQLQTESILQEVDIKDLMNIPKQKIENSLKNIKSAFQSKNISKLKTIIKTIPKVEFSQIEKLAKSKIANFNSMYFLSQKVLTKSLPIEKQDKKLIKMISALLSVISSADKDPKNKLKSLLKKVISEIKNDGMFWFDLIMILIVISLLTISGIIAGVSALSILYILILTLIFAIIIVIISVLIELKYFPKNN